MENSPKQQDNQNPSFLPSPNSSSSSSSSSNSSGPHHHRHHHHHQPPQQPPPPPPPPPKPITRSESNPYPTTFVQADTSSFKQVVQMLTGSSETAKQASSSHKPTSDSPKNHQIPPRKQGFKLYERRNSAKNFKISPLLPGFNPTPTGFSPRKPEILSPSILDFPSLVLSPVTPLMIDPFNRSPQNGACCVVRNKSGDVLNSDAEEKAIAEKGFYLHPSPATTPRDPEPRLLPLFPVTSPRVSGSSS